MFGLIPFKMNRVYKEDVFDNFLSEFFNDDFFDMSNINGSFKADIRETDNEYLVEAELPGVKKEDINLEYYNNYVTLQVKRNLFYSNNENIAVAIVQPGGDINEDYYVENADPNGIRAVLKNDTLNVLIPKSTYISKDTTIVEVDNFKEEQI